MEELFKKLGDALKENRALKHQIVDLQAEIDMREQELLMVRESVQPSPGIETESRDKVQDENGAGDTGEMRQYLQTIREYVTGLTGYRMEFHDGEIVFHSLYAFDSDDVFIFRYKSGNMELVNNEFAASWGAEIQSYLVAGKSIPAFLAAVTLELFNRKTFG